MSQTSIFKILVVLALSAGGCAHSSKSQNQTESLKPTAASSATEAVSESDSKAKELVSDESGKIVFRGIQLKNTQFDFPVTLNSRVEYWMDYFTGRGRPHFARYLERSEFFIPYITPILKSNGMPEDLVYLAMIESGFNNHARSHARAVGPWQFISATGKRYGLMVNWWVDERRDTQKSTLAAVAYLKDLHNMFQSWELAASAYNAGENKIVKAIRRFGTKDFWVLSRQRYLRQETRDYVPKIIAAALIAKNRTQFGFPGSNIHPGKDEVISGDGEIVKVIRDTDQVEMQQSSQTARSPETIEELLKSNDAKTLANVYEEGAADEVDSVTRGQVARASVEEEAKADVPVQLAKPVQTPHVNRKGEVTGEDLAEFEVQSPADLLKIARAAGVSYQTVKSLNPELVRWCTPPSVPSFRVKLPASLKDKFLATYNHEAFPRKVQFMTHKVKRGENVSKIARHYGLSADPIADLNGISARAGLASGSKILLPVPSDRSRSMASLEVIDAPERRKSRTRKTSRRRSSASVLQYNRISKTDRLKARYVNYTQQY